MAYLRSLSLFSPSKVNQVRPLLAAVNCSQTRGKHGDVPVENVVGQFHNSVNQTEKGKVYDKKPFKFQAVKGKAYMWCACGHSKSQPFCDGTHRNNFLNIKIRPVRFMVDEDKEVWLCNCKQTSKRPFCDGTHRSDDVVKPTTGQSGQRT